MIVLFDIDGTLANVDHRLPMLEEDEIDWSAFEKQCEYDTPIESTIEIVNAFYNDGYQVWLWTGRSDGVRDETVNWMREAGVKYHQLLMAPKGYDATVTQLKRRWLDDDPIPRRKVLCAYDDDPRIIKMLLEEGVTCYQIKRPDDGQP